MEEMLATLIARWNTPMPSLCRTAAGLELYIALDRPDIAYSVKTALKQMSKPTKLMQLRVVLVARYSEEQP